MQNLSFGEKFVFIKVINGTIKQNNVIVLNVPLKW